MNSSVHNYTPLSKRYFEITSVIIISHCEERSDEAIY